MRRRTSSQSVGGRQSEPAAVSEKLGDRFRAEPVVEQLELIGSDERWVRDAARAAEREHVLSKRHDVVCEPPRLERGIQPRTSQGCWVATPVGQ